MPVLELRYLALAYTSPLSNSCSLPVNPNGCPTAAPDSATGAPNTSYPPRARTSPAAVVSV